MEIEKESELKQGDHKFDTGLSIYGFLFKTSAIHGMHSLTCKQKQ